MMIPDDGLASWEAHYPRLCHQGVAIVALSGKGPGAATDGTALPVCYVCVEASDFQFLHQASSVGHEMFRSPLQCYSSLLLFQFSVSVSSS